jgi:3-hydroxyisobutyrate dehydrogenase-like beta-hydroxyacid dehydrogenase
MPKPPASKPNSRNIENGDLIMQANAPVGIIGLGLMGTALSERLIDAGVPLIGFDIEASNCEKLKARGGMVATSVHELAGRSRTIVIAVYSGGQVEALFGELESGAGPERPMVVCTTTCAPDEMTRLAQRAASAGIALLEAPISGTSAELRAGTATALLAGETSAIESVSTLLYILCPRRVRVGAIGDASRTKLAINLILQNNRAALAEGIVFAERLGLDGRAFLTAARDSAAYSRVMDTKGEKMLTRDFGPQSHISQTLKDAELILEQARRRGLLLPMTTTQAELMRAAIALEGPDSDSAAVIEAIRRPAITEVSR